MHLTSIWDNRDCYRLNIKIASTGINKSNDTLIASYATVYTEKIFPYKLHISDQTEPHFCIAHTRRHSA